MSYFSLSGHGKVQLSLQQGQNKGHFRGFCSMLKCSPVQRPACEVCRDMGHVGAKATWLWREHGKARGSVSHVTRQNKREETLSLGSLTRSFFKLINFPRFLELLMGSIP